MAFVLSFLFLVSPSFSVSRGFVIVAFPGRSSSLIFLSSLETIYMQGLLQASKGRSQFGCNINVFLTGCISTGVLPAVNFESKFQISKIFRRSPFSSIMLIITCILLTETILIRSSVLYVGGKTRHISVVYPIPATKQFFFCYVFMHVLFGLIVFRTSSLRKHAYATILKISSTKN